MTDFLVKLFSVDVHGNPFGAATLIKLAVVSFLVSVLRSFFAAGPAYFVFWKWLRDPLHHRRIQEKYPATFRLWRELGWSLSTMVVYSALGLLFYAFYQVGWTRAYRNVSDYGWGYYVFSIVLMIVLHDAYFYWTHRLLHWKPLFRRVHRVHHESVNPSPWAAFSFHPIEAAISFGIIPVIVWTMPFHVSAIKLFIIYMTLMNVLGHLGYEIFPRGFTRNAFTWWHNTSTHHNLHHRRVHCNYSLYFNIWDHLMGTNWTSYHETYDKVTATPLLKRRAQAAQERREGRKVAQPPVTSQS